jgi:hypothetical protein
LVGLNSSMKKTAIYRIEADTNAELDVLVKILALNPKITIYGAHYEEGAAKPHKQIAVEYEEPDSK